MYLRKTTFIVIIAIIVSFLMRTFGTVFPQMFKNVLLVKATILIHALFILSHLLFWMLFYREYISAKKASLKRICVLVIFGSFAVSVIYLKRLSFAFGMNIQLPLFLLNPYFDALVPLISSAFHLFFFIAFRRSLEINEKARLSKPILSVVIGTFIYICLNLIVLFNFFAKDTFEWLEHMQRVVAISTVPLIIVSGSLILFFYYKFYDFLDSSYHIETGNERPS